MTNVPALPAPSHPLLGLAGWMALTFSAALAGALASVDAPSFYAMLARPGWAPPARVFGPVWTVLYTVIAIAAWLAWKRAPLARAPGLWMLFVAQLAANAMWSWLFFRVHSGLAAFAGVLVLEALVLATLVGFWRVRPLAGALLVPYAAWVLFATALTWSVWRANPAILG